MHLRTVAAIAVAAALLALPAGAHAGTPVFGKNAELVAQVPEAAGAVAIEWHSKKPLMVLSTARGLQTFDVSDPLEPKRLGVLPMVLDQNEGMDLVERGDKTYALIAVNLAAVGIRGSSPELITSNRHLLVADVSDPSKPAIVSSLQLPTRTHTISCASRACPYAYSDGRTATGLPDRQPAISIVDLTDPLKPKVADTFRTVVPQGHDQDVDEAGILWHVGGQGSVALDVTNPTAPVQLNATNDSGVGRRGAGDYAGNPYNNFIHHNSYRPEAEQFDDSSGDSGPADVDRGNVLLVTEEDYVNFTGSGTARCGDYEGSFQTWRVPWLDAERFADRLAAGIAASGTPYGHGTIEPLDRWNTELLDSGIETPAGAFCSAHYFDYLPGGYVAQGWYQQGTRILDVRDPTDIKQVGYWFTGATETWGAYWVPKHIAGKRTIVYTADHVRGIDVLKVKLPKRKAGKTRAVRAPILRSWVRPKAGLAARSSRDWGFVCPLPLA